MNNTTYNGRTNRETRLVSLHFDITTMEDLESAKEYINEIDEWIENSFLSDFVDFGKINWNEIAEHTEEYED